MLILWKTKSVLIESDWISNQAIGSHVGATTFKSPKRQAMQKLQLFCVLVYFFI